MDDLDNAKCQKSRRRDMIGIFYLLMNEEKDKIWNSGHLLKLKSQNVRGWKMEMQ